jgi:hypothetical protein
MAKQGRRQGQPGGEDRQQNPQGGIAGQSRAGSGAHRPQAQEGQNQSGRRGNGGRK